MNAQYVFSSESVGEGHPDKVADAISDAVLDACLREDPQSRVACETLVKDDKVLLAGEITTVAKPNYEALVRQTLRTIGYDHPAERFSADKVQVHTWLSQQSPDIAQGVDAVAAEGKSTAQQGAGDQGIMFGYACNDTPEFMPVPIVYAHRLAKRLRHLRQENVVNWLRPDCKTQVACEFSGNQVLGLRNIVVSTCHSEDVYLNEVRSFCRKEVIDAVIPPEWMTPQTEAFINPTGRFLIGGPESDAGLTGRKIIVDTYGGWSRHGGGAFSGKDPSKVDRSASYMCRWVAKNIVAAGLAERVELEVAYAIGYPEPTSILVNTFGTGVLPEDQILGAVNEVFSFRPADIVSQLDLLRPIYSESTHFGHFGKASLPWEQLSRVDALRGALGRRGAVLSSEPLGV